MTRAARRAVLRIAWRDARRNRWRTLLVVAMIAIPVAGLTLGTIGWATSTPSPEERATGEMGAADLVVHGGDEAFAAVSAGLPAGSDTAVVHGVSGSAVVDGGVEYVLIESLDIDGPVLAGRYRLLEGRPPTRPGEIAVAPVTLTAFALEIGDRLELDSPDLGYLITGTVINPEHLDTPTAIVAPGTLAEVEGVGTVGMYVDLPAAAEGDVPITDDLAVGHFTREDAATDFGTGNGVTPYAVSFAIAAVALAETGLIVAAAFVVGARRQLRSLGLVGAAGGEPAHVRGIVLWAGAALGLVGSVVGVGTGIVGGVLLAPHLDRLVSRVTGGVVFPVPILVGAVLLGLLAAVAAAWVPAHTAGRLSTVEALAGRRPAPAPAGRTAGVGIVSVVLGTAMLTWGTIDHSNPLIAAGLLAILGGVLLAIPLLVGWVARASTRLPPALRIAGRDTGRHGRRTGAAVAAATLALALPVAISAVTLSDEARDNATPVQAPDHLTVSAEGVGAASWEGVQAVIDAVSSRIDVVAAAPLVRAGFDPDRYPLPDDWGPIADFTVYASGRSYVIEEGPDFQSISGTGGPVTIGDAEVLTALHAEEMIDDLEAGTMVVLGSGVVDGGVMRLDIPVVDPDAPWHPVEVPAVESGGTGYDSLAIVLVSEQRADELGLVAGPVWNGVVRTDAEMEGAVLAEAKAAAATVPGGYVWSLADSRSSSTPLRTVLLGFAAAVALATIGVAVALVSAESRRDKAVLVAVGAGPGTRRRVVAGSALLLAALAAVLAVPAGFLPVAVIQTARQGGYPVVVPWSTIAVVVILVPLLAALVAGAVSRNPGSTMMLRPAD